MLCAIIKVAFAITCMCHVTLAAMRFQMVVDRDGAPFADSSLIVNFSDEERQQAIQFISNNSKEKQVVVYLPIGPLDNEDASLMRMKAIEDDNTNKVRMVVVNFYEPTTRNVLQIKKAIEFDEMKAFYRLLMELKRELLSQDRDFVVLTDWKMRKSGVLHLFRLPTAFYPFYEKHVKVDPATPDVIPEFKGHYLIEWEHVWRYISPISSGNNLVDTGFDRLPVYVDAEISE